MQQVVSASAGTTATGRFRYSGWICCSTEAKKLFRSMCRKPKRAVAKSGWSSIAMLAGRGLVQPRSPDYIRLSFASGCGSSGDLPQRPGGMQRRDELQGEAIVVRDRASVVVVQLVAGLDQF